MSARRQWLLVATISLTVAVCLGAFFYSFSVFLARGAAGGTFPVGLLSVAISGAMLVAGLLAPWVGRLTASISIRAIMTLGGLLGALGLVLFSLADDAWVVIAVWTMVIGPAQALTLYEPAYVAVVHWVDQRRRAPALGVLTAVGGTSGVWVIPLTERMVAAVGWRSAALLLAGLVLLTVVAAAAWLPSTGTGAFRASSGGPRLRALCADRNLMVFSAAIVTAFSLMQVGLSHQVALFEDLGHPLAVVTGWAALSALLSLPSRVVAPVVAARIGIRPVLTGVMAGMAAAFVVAVWVGQSWRLAGFFCVFGVCMGALLPLRAMAMSRWFSGVSYARVMGWQWALISTVGSICSSGAGIWHERNGGYRLPFTLLAALAIGAAALVAVATRNRRTS